MQLTAQSVKPLLQITRIERQLLRNPEELKVIACGRLEGIAVRAKTHGFRRAAFPAGHAKPYAENEVPQPQFFFAFGFSKTKPDCMRDSL